MKFITLSGVDGSGKSTQLSMLQKQFEEQGLRVAYFHAVSFSLIETVRSKIFGARKAGSAPAKTKSSILSLWLRQFLLLIDTLRFRRYFARLKETDCDYLLSDRYFYDTLINIAYLAKSSPKNAYSLFLYRLLPKPDQALYLRIIPEQVMKRENAPEQGLSYLKEKTALFESVVGTWKLTPINADQTIDDVTRQILTHTSV